MGGEAVADLAGERSAIELLKRSEGDLLGGAILNEAEAAALLSLLVEADAFISHMRHRRSWPGDQAAVDALIGRLRRAS